MSTSATQELSPARCPLCGQDNACAMEQARLSGQAAGTCWCVQAHIGPELLAQLPVQARGKSCICLACVTRGGPPD